MRIVSVFGTRPEWVKLSPLIPLLDRAFTHKMVHTAQHYSPALDQAVRRDLGLRAPDLRLRRPGQGFSEQMAAMLPALERALRKERPDLVLVQGDTNSSLAGALAAARLGIAVAHVEAGCRSGNLAAPEEQNRRLIDAIASLLFAADREALVSLRREGRKDALLAGSTGVDAVLRSSSLCQDAFLVSHGVSPERFALATLHRAENTESRSALRLRLETLAFAARSGPVLLALHPRTRAAMRRFSLRAPPGVRVTPALAYLEFLSLLRRCRFALSDSGGLQEEAAALGRPCVVLREETEWARLVSAGKNFLLPELDAGGKRLLRKLWEDERFLAKARARKARGLEPGASERIVRGISAWRRR